MKLLYTPKFATAVSEQVHRSMPFCREHLHSSF